MAPVTEERTAYLGQQDTFDASQLHADAVVRLPDAPNSLLRERREIEFPAMLAVPTERGIYFTLNGQIHSEDNEPIQPLHVVDLSNNYGPMHGVIFIGGTYHDVPSFDPVIESAGDLNRLQDEPPPEPTFDIPGWYPAMPQSVNILSTVGPRKEQMAMTVGQFDATSCLEHVWEYQVYDIYLLQLSGLYATGHQRRPVLLH